MPALITAELPTRDLSPRSLPPLSEPPPFFEQSASYPPDSPMAPPAQVSYASWSQRPYPAQGSWNTIPYPQAAHYELPPPPPPPPPQKVWILDCKTCGMFLTNRGMKAVLLLRPSVSLYSTDGLPANCSAYGDAVIPSSGAASATPARTCECVTQTLCCHGCGASVGYMIVAPCARCTQSVGTSQRATNGHRFVFHAAEIVASERHYVLNEHGVHRATTPAHPPVTAAPTFAFPQSVGSFGTLGPSGSIPSATSWHSIAHMDAVDGPATTRTTSNGTTGSLPELVAASPRRPTFAARATVSPVLDPHRVGPLPTENRHRVARYLDDRPTDFESEDSGSEDDAHDRPVLRADTTADTLDYSGALDDIVDDTPSPLSPSARRAAALGLSPLPHGAAQTARELVAARAQLVAHQNQLAHLRALRASWETAAASATAAAQQERAVLLRAGDVVYWHHLSKSGEIPGVREEPRARVPRSTRITPDR